MEAGQRKVDTVVGIMSATPEAGLDLTNTAWIEGTVCYGASSGFHFLLLYLKLELFKSVVTSVRSLISILPKMTRWYQPTGASSSTFPMKTCVPIEKGAAAMLVAQQPFLVVLKVPDDPVSSSAIEYW